MTKIRQNYNYKGIPDKPGIAAKGFRRTAKGGINVDMIIQSATKEKLMIFLLQQNRTDLKKR